eukprot:TRINITY_DN13744_c0_g2_i1.p1 TRINITY_DN13744_c0_g2~~TRINITY_DN13744_c0_g2_i1.p1  ORF type:complete len:149 (+),score=47.16 TRINITY_DN13744_c0_g2_i1:193-639(+)
MTHGPALMKVMRKLERENKAKGGSIVVSTSELNGWKIPRTNVREGHWQFDLNVAFDDEETEDEDEDAMPTQTTESTGPKRMRTVFEGERHQFPDYDGFFDYTFTEDTDYYQRDFLDPWGYDGVDDSLEETVGDVMKALVNADVALQKQ